VVAAALGAASSAAADPVAFSADEVSGTVTVVDVNTGIVRATIAVSDTFPREPRDVAVDPKSGRVFVAADGQLISFDGRQPDGRGMHRVLARANGSSLAIDERGRRVFMAHEETSQSTGVVSEFSIADPIRPTLVREHVVPGMTDLRLVAYDWPNARVYVVDDDGKIARTGRGDTSFAYFGDLSGAPGGILVDPMGGVWVSIRGSTNGKLFRLTEPGALTRYTFMGYSQPRGIAWDVLAPGTILVAIDATPGQIMRFTPSTGALTLVMSTDPKPQDVGVTAGGARVSVNRVASGVDGTMTKNAAYLAPTGEKPVALAVTELARLTADPPSKGFCYSRIGDTAEQTFTIQNTRIDRGSIDLLPVAFGGANPANYQLVGTNSCSAARLQWGQSCAFRVRFTASGPSVEPPPRFGTVLTASWPAEAIVSGTGGSATTRIPLRGAFSLNSCYTLPPLIPTSPIYTFP
jgi:DNA-binding beta-propeller fold protein YncE